MRAVVCAVVLALTSPISAYAQYGSAANAPNGPPRRGPHEAVVNPYYGSPNRQPLNSDQRRVAQLPRVPASSAPAGTSSSGQPSNGFSSPRRDARYGGTPNYSGVRQPPSPPTPPTGGLPRSGVAVPGSPSAYGGGAFRGGPAPPRADPTSATPRSAAATPPAALPPVIPTRQSTFVIPFTVDEADGAPIEVQLFVSADRGATWSLYARQRPSETQFRFQAERDGEYWFAPKTIDRSNRVRPAGPPQPGLRMLVDTTQPGFRFDARLGRSGEVVTSWEAHDDHLDPNSLVVEYQDAVGTGWRPVAVDPPNGSGDQPSYRSAVSWWPETNSRAINVRAEIRDKAGNRAVVNRQVFLPRKRPTPSVNATDAGKSAAAPPRPSTTAPWRLGGGQSSQDAGSAASVPSDPFARSTDSGAIPWLGPETPPKESPSSAAALTGDVRPGRTNSAGLGDNYRPETPNPSNDRYADNREPWSGPAPTRSPSRDATYKPASGPSSLPLSERPTPKPPSEPRQRHYGLPPGERPRVTNRRHFSLEYDVDAVGPAGVAAVELWATTDAGRNWARWGEDPDRTSPFEVEVEDEGIYGFRIVIVGNNGLASRSPRQGDLADIWIAIDSTQPEGRLTSAAYGKAHEAGNLIIQWKAQDDWLAPRPITLLFSGKLDGPWTTIASGLPNDGRYVWKADPRLPRRFYLRMEVRDQAGNTGTYQLNDPISSEGLTPKGRIRGFLP